jgi:hypothetical protein
MDGEYEGKSHDRRLRPIGGWLSLTQRMPEPVDRPGPVETASEALEGAAEEMNPFPRLRA